MSQNPANSDSVQKNFAILVHILRYSAAHPAENGRRHPLLSDLARFREPPVTAAH